MQFILNIGIDGVNPGAALAAGTDLITALRASCKVSATMLAHGLAPLDITVHQSGTEPTVVCTVEMTEATAQARIGLLAVALNQDCIGMYCPQTGQGHLSGPAASAWGDFNPDYFLLDDGTTLAAGRADFNEFLQSSYA